MARKEAVFEPNDPGLVSPTTESTEGTGAAIDPDYEQADPIPSSVPGIDGDFVTLADPRPSPGVGVDPDSSKVTDIAPDGPSLVDGHGEITEAAPGMMGEAETMPLDSPGDLSAFGRSSLLPDDLDVGDESGFGGAVDPGTDLGSTLLDDLAGDLSDSSAGLDGMSDSSGPLVLDDQTGWNMSGDHQGAGGGQYGPSHTEMAEEFFAGAADAAEEGDGEAMAANLLLGTFETSLAAEEAAAPDTTQPPTSDGREEDGPVDHWGNPLDFAGQDREGGERESTGDGPPDSESMPAPDDGTGGDPDESDFIGEKGDADPAPEAEDHGGAGALDTVAAGQGAVDLDSDLDDAGDLGTLDMERVGMEAIDPIDGESSLLDGDEGDLAAMAADVALGGEPFEVEFDDSFADADIGEDG